LFEEEVKFLSALSEKERYERGSLFKDQYLQKYQPKMLLRESFWFRPAVVLPFYTNDTLACSICYLFKWPLFVNRDQVERLATGKMFWRLPPCPEDRRKLGGYSVEMFD
jgi:hypothetical protein